MPIRPHDIVLVLTSFDVGGTERQMVDLVRRLDPSRFRPHIACFRDGGPLRARVPDDIAVRRFPLRSFARPGAGVQLLAFAVWCRRIGARLVHTCDFYANVFGLPGAVLGGVPARIANRREVVIGHRTRAQLTAQRLAYGVAGVVVANSAAARDQLHLEGIPADKVRLIPNGLDLSGFAAPTGGAAPLRRVVMVANLRPEKGHDTLLAAIPAIVARHPDATFTIAGDGPRGDALRTLARALALDGRVRFLGEAPDVPALLAASDLFVLPSRSDACPNALIEAMAAGLPVVASDVGGIPELVRPGTTGALVPPDDPGALAAAVVGLMDDPARARAIGAAARGHVERHHAIERMVEAFEQLYLMEIEEHVWNRGNRRQPRVAH